MCLLVLFRLVYVYIKTTSLLLVHWPEMVGMIGLFSKQSIIQIRVNVFWFPANSLSYSIFIALVKPDCTKQNKLIVVDSRRGGEG